MNKLVAGITAIAVIGSMAMASGESICIEKYPYTDRYYVHYDQKNDQVVVSKHIKGKNSKHKKIDYSGTWKRAEYGNAYVKDGEVMFIDKEKKQYLGHYCNDKEVMEKRLGKIDKKEKVKKQKKAKKVKNAKVTYSCTVTYSYRKLVFSNKSSFYEGNGYVYDVLDNEYKHQNTHKGIKYYTNNDKFIAIEKYKTDSGLYRYNIYEGNYNANGVDVKYEYNCKAFQYKK